MNFDARMMTRTMPVPTRPMPLMTRECFHLRRSLTEAEASVRSSRVQWRIIPVWLTVKEMKTPTTYNWISAVTEALKTSTRMMAPVASVRMPLE